MTPQEAARRRLIRQLQAAHAGELAAGLAYRGHGQSVADPAEREDLCRIEAEEWHHRSCLAAMLAALGAQPRRARELTFGLIGRALAIACHVSGWYVPMYGAGRLERGNVREYEVAARSALESGHVELIEALLTMAEVEWEHERFFREKIARHPWTRVVPLWRPLPPKVAIRESFAADAALDSLAIDDQRSRGNSTYAVPPRAIHTVSRSTRR